MRVHSRPSSAAALRSRQAAKKKLYAAIQKAKDAVAAEYDARIKVFGFDPDAVREGETTNEVAVETFLDESVIVVG